MKISVHIYNANLGLLTDVWTNNRRLLYLRNELVHSFLVFEQGDTTFGFVRALVQSVTRIWRLINYLCQSDRRHWCD